MAVEHSKDRIVATNRKALHDYFVIETLEAGIALKGTEVKSLREGNVNLLDAYATIRNGEVWLLGLHINPFEKGNINNHDPKRERRLLLHKSEIRKLLNKTNDKGLTLVPLNIHFTNNIAKVELAIVKGKKLHDKREAIKSRDVEREMRRHSARDY